jgi:hypothetical protein
MEIWKVNAAVGHEAVLDHDSASSGKAIHGQSQWAKSKAYQRNSPQHAAGSWKEQA